MEYDTDVSFTDEGLARFKFYHLQHLKEQIIQRQHELLTKRSAYVSEKLAQDGYWIDNFQDNSFSQVLERELCVTRWKLLLPIKPGGYDYETYPDLFRFHEQLPHMNFLHFNSTTMKLEPWCQVWIFATTQNQIPETLKIFFSS